VGARTHVLDASAVLALLLGECGLERVRPNVPTAAISAVNWSEACRRLSGATPRGTGGLIAARHRLSAVGAVIEPFDLSDAESAAGLRGVTRGAGLSLGDRACLALAQRLGVPAVTADRAWADLDVGIEVQLIR
jgi:PIN domain nuclease of toxin-antitoxin system